MFKGCYENRYGLASLSLTLMAFGNAWSGDLTLAPTGTLRAAYIAANVAQARRDPDTGSITGVAADIAHELGRQAGVPVTITPLPTAASVLEAVRKGSADIGFVAPNPERTGVVLFSQTYMLVQQSALVRADSPLHSIHELDKPGQVIGVNTDDSVAVWLQQRLKAAHIRSSPDYTWHEPFQWLHDGTVTAFAGGRQRLVSGAKNEPGLRLLSDNFYGVPQTIAVPLNRQDRLVAVNTAIDAMRESGFLADSIRHSGIEGLTVAPAEAQNR